MLLWAYPRACIVKLVGFMNDGSSIKLSELDLFRQVVSCDMPGPSDNDLWDMTEYPKLETEDDAMDLIRGCAGSLEFGENVVIFQLESPIDDGRSLGQQLAFYARHQTDAGAVGYGDVLYNYIDDDIGVTKVIDICHSFSNRFQVFGYTGIVLLDGLSEGRIVVDEDTAILATHPIPTSREELAVQCGFADRSYRTRVIRTLTDEELRSLPPLPPAYAYHEDVNATIFRMIALLPSKSCRELPIDYNHITENMVRGIIRRLAFMGLVEESGEGFDLTEKGRVAASVLLCLKLDVHAACLAACAVVDKDLSTAARRVVFRLAAVQAAGPIANRHPGNPEAQEDSDRFVADIRDHCWGTGRRFCRMGSLWAMLGLLDKTRLLSDGFKNLRDTPGFLQPISGIVKLRENECGHALAILQTLEKEFGIVPSDNPEAYDLDSDNFDRVQIHLAYSFFERMCVVDRDDEEMPFHLTGRTQIDELFSVIRLRAAETSSDRDERGNRFFYSHAIRLGDSPLLFLNATVSHETEHPSLAASTPSVPEEKWSTVAPSAVSEEELLAMFGRARSLLERYFCDNPEEWLAVIWNDLYKEGLLEGGGYFALPIRDDWLPLVSAEVMVGLHQLIDPKRGVDIRAIDELWREQGFGPAVIRQEIGQSCASFD
ncbi:hypothetical protein VTK26DRAFT_6531 [Humicola hyalothermophila]